MPASYLVTASLITAYERSSQVAVGVFNLHVSNVSCPGYETY